MADTTGFDGPSEPRLQVLSLKVWLGWRWDRGEWRAIKAGIVNTYTDWSMQAHVIALHYNPVLDCSRCSPTPIACLVGWREGLPPCRGATIEPHWSPHSPFPRIPRAVVVSTLSHTESHSPMSPSTASSSTAPLKRRSKACESCRVRRTKCSGEVPCTACVSNGISATCQIRAKARPSR